MHYFDVLYFVQQMDKIYLRQNTYFIYCSKIKKIVDSALKRTFAQAGVAQGIEC